MNFISITYITASTYKYIQKNYRVLPVHLLLT